MADPPIQFPYSGVRHLDGQSKYYMVVITSSRWGDVYAWLPDSIQFLVRSNWAPIVGNVGGSLMNFALIKGSEFFGAGPITFTSKRLSAQEWEGSEPLDLQLPLHFFATQDAGLEVIEPIRKLMKMALPRKRRQDSDDTFLVPPGPVPRVFGSNSEADRDPNSDRINVYIGNYCRITDMFISVIQQIEFLGKLSTDGIPMEAKCNVVFRTLFSPIADDVDGYFNAPTLGTGLGAPAYNVGS